MNFLLRTRLKGQKRRANSGVFQNSASNKTMFECNSALHVRSTVIYALSDRQEPIMDLPCLLIVLGLSGLDELDKRLGGDVSITNQETVDIECSVEKVFVVA